MYIATALQKHLYIITFEAFGLAIFTVQSIIIIIVFIVKGMEFD